MNGKIIKPTDFKSMENLKNKSDKSFKREKRKKLSVETVAQNKRMEGEEEMLDFSDDDSFEPFNLCEERGGGYFDKDGNYFPDKEDDPWLDEINDYQTPNSSKKLNINSESTILPPTPKNKVDILKVAEIRRKMAEQMHPSEKVSELLARIGKEKEKDALNWLMAALDYISMDFGELEIYDFSREELLQKAELEEQANLSRVENSEKAKNGFGEILGKKITHTFFRDPSISKEMERWEFVWEDSSSSNAASKVEGPYSLTQLKEWHDKGSFDVKPILFREIGAKKWMRSAYFLRLFELYDD